jgi:regulator of sigma E protease
METAMTSIKQQAGKHVTLVFRTECPETAACAGPEVSVPNVYVRPAAEVPQGQGSVGLEFGVVSVQHFFPWYEMPIRATAFGMRQAFSVTQAVLIGLGQIVRDASHGHVSEGLAGPVGIVAQVVKLGVFEQSVFDALYFAAIISVNLAVMNILPIPALDGGRALFIVIEMIGGKRWVQRFESRANTVGFTLLLALIVLVTIRDVVKLVMDFLHA